MRMNTDAYCDMCIQENGQSKQVLERLFSHQFHLVCINRTIDLSEIKPKGQPNSKAARKHFRDKVAQQLQPMDLSVFDDSKLAQYARVHGSRAKIFSRLTIRFEEVDSIQQVCQAFSSELANNFDVIAVCPCSAAAFNFACDQLVPVDLIQLDTSDTPKYRMTHQMVRRARDRSLNFEILLYPMLTGTTCRAYTVSVVQNFVDTISNRALVLSSGARSVWDIRNHVGLISIAAMLGLRSDLAPQCVRDVPRAVLKHALVRTRTVFGAMAIEKLQSQPGVKSVTVVRDEEAVEKQSVAAADAKVPPLRRKGFIDLDKAPEASGEPPKKKKKKNSKSKNIE